MQWIFLLVRWNFSEVIYNYSHPGACFRIMFNEYFMSWRYMLVQIELKRCDTHCSVFFYWPMTNFYTPENVRTLIFSRFDRGYRNRTLPWNGVNRLLLAGNICKYLRLKRKKTVLQYRCIIYTKRNYLWLWTNVVLMKCLCLSWAKNENIRRKN